jgi:preprotein translocase subunit SecD
MPVCPNCGTEVIEGLEYCPHCGQRLKKEPIPEEKQNYVQELEASAQDEKPPKKTRLTNKQLAAIIVGCIAAIVVLVVIFTHMPTPATPHGLNVTGGVYLVYQADLSQVSVGSQMNVMNEVKKVIEGRINAMGISQSIVSVQEQEDSYSIAIQLPGFNEMEKAKEMLGRAGLVEFREQDAAGNWIPATGTVNSQNLTLTSGYFKENTHVTVDQYGRPLLAFEWDATGAQLSKQITTRLLGKELAIFLGDDLIQAATVQDVIEDKGQIEGLSLADATELSKLLNAGRMPVPLGRWAEQGDSKVFEANVPLYEELVMPP